jgi:outer membrane protease
MHIFPVIGFSYQNRKCSAMDGYLQYPVIEGDPWTGEEAEQPVQGTVISYEQSLWSPNVGLKVIFFIHDRILLGLDFLWIPYIFADSLDSHFLRSVQFYDTLRGGYGLRFAGSVNYFPQKSDLGMFVRLGYEKNEVYGNTSSSSIGIGSDGFQISEGCVSGTRGEGFSFSLGVSYKGLFWN